MTASAWIDEYLTEFLIGKPSKTALENSKFSGQSCANYVVKTMNLTLSIDEKLLERVRAAAQAQGKSVNQLVREYLEQLPDVENLENVIADFRKTSGLGHRRNLRLNRDELHERNSENRPGTFC
ncbi:MAG TPA: DUF6364 family protein [Gammaproteobacteria bacterium]